MAPQDTCVQISRHIHEWARMGVSCVFLMSESAVPAWSWIPGPTTQLGDLGRSLPGATMEPMT